MELMAEMKAMVETFNENMRAMHVNMVYRHNKERKQLLRKYKQNPKGRFSPIVNVTAEELEKAYFNLQPSLDEARENEADC